jgi:hypothetical protein
MGVVLEGHSFPLSFLLIDALLSEMTAFSHVSMKLLLSETTVSFPLSFLLMGSLFALMGMLLLVGKTTSFSLSFLLFEEYLRL